MTARNGHDLVAAILRGDHAHYALLHRPRAPRAGARGSVDVIVGDVAEHDALADVPLDGARGPDAGPGPDVLLVVPYRQLAERGFPARDDGTPLVALTVTGHAVVEPRLLVDAVPDLPTELTGHRFDVDDDAYADIVRRVVRDEIGSGRGANFVVRRTFCADISDYSPAHALAFFRRLLEREEGAYWTFLVRVEGRTLVGATPEQHVALGGGVVTMNPISGTYRYPATGPTLDGVMEFLADRKEVDELYMVLDEELKTMARICERGGRVRGPYLKEMARVAHTEYVIEGNTRQDVRAVLRETMFAPTVTGSPVESAAEVIHRYEPEGRRYYSGIAALVGRDADGARTLDSAILIRTAEVEDDGTVRIPVGATLVRHSDPRSEAAETRAKVAGLLGALEHGAPRFARHPRVLTALRGRNDGIADFWFTDGPVPQAPGAQAPAVDAAPQGCLEGVRILVVDAEDTFTAMLGHQLRALGATVTVREHREPYALDGYDLVVLGPGPGDPGDLADPKMAHLHGAVDTLLRRRRPFLAVCLSHQVLSGRLGLPLLRRDEPNQGVQCEVDLFGHRERVGFYNTFAAVSDEDKIDVDDVGLVEISRDPVTGQVHALRGDWFASVQFHPESVLTVDGPRILATAAREVLGR